MNTYAKFIELGMENLMAINLLLVALAAFVAVFFAAAFMAYLDERLDTVEKAKERRRLNIERMCEIRRAQARSARELPWIIEGIAYCIERERTQRNGETVS